MKQVFLIKIKIDNNGGVLSVSDLSTIILEFEN